MMRGGFSLIRAAAMENPLGTEKRRAFVRESIQMSTRLCTTADFR